MVGCVCITLMKRRERELVARLLLFVLLAALSSINNIILDNLRPRGLVKNMEYSGERCDRVESSRAR